MRVPRFYRRAMRKAQANAIESIQIQQMRLIMEVIPRWKRLLMEYSPYFKELFQYSIAVEGDDQTKITLLQGKKGKMKVIAKNYDT